MIRIARHDRDLDWVRSTPCSDNNTRAKSRWLAFESGTAMALNYKAIFALLTTNLCAASGCLTWLLLDCEFLRLERSSYPDRKTGLMSLDSCL